MCRAEARPTWNLGVPGCGGSDFSPTKRRLRCVGLRWVGLWSDEMEAALCRAEAPTYMELGVSGCGGSDFSPTKRRRRCVGLKPDLHGPRVLCVSVVHSTVFTDHDALLGHAEIGGDDRALGL